MEFMQRGGQNRTSGVTRGASAHANAAADPGPASVPDQDDSEGNRFVSRSGNSGSGKSGMPWGRLSRLILLFAVTILAVAAIFFLAFGKGTYKEQALVEKNQLQAVFINVNGTNGGQVYFGNIEELNRDFIRLKNVFYIQNQNSQNQQSNSAYNLVKLGCELHGPEDQMVINRSEVFFWENLKNDSQVAQKVEEFKKQNPGGQKCTTNNSQTGTGQSSTNTQTPANTTGGTGTGNTTGTTNNQPNTNTNQ